MKREQGNTLVVLMFYVGLIFGAGMLTMWGVPKVWAWLKPILAWWLTT